MPKKLTRDVLTSQRSALDALMAALNPEDAIGRASLSYKKSSLDDEPAALDVEMETLASVVLAFEGGPVTGSRGVDAEFASDALRSYQDLVANQMMATETGGLGQRGPVPDKSATRLNITNIVHGSFGFQLEERNGDQPQFIDSALKNSIRAVDDLIVDFASFADANYTRAIEQIDRRVFVSLQKFYENLYSGSASIKIIESERSFSIDNNSVILARGRVRGVSVEDVQITIVGQLLGLTPVSKRFDLRPTVSDTVLSGQVGQRLSDDYIERLRYEKRVSGQVYRATLLKRTTTQADGSFSESYTLTDLNDTIEGSQAIQPRPE